MRIGLTACGTTVNEVVEHAQWAESQGFTGLWFGGGFLGDPLAAITVAGRATTSIEFGTSVLQTYPCHPLLQANRAAAAAAAMGRPGLTLGLGPSHAGRINGTYGLPYAKPAQSTEEYVDIVTRVLRGDAVDVTGSEWSAHSPAIAVPHAVPVLIAAMMPRMVRLAGTIADGTVLYLVSAQVIEQRIRPAIDAAAQEAGRPTPRIVAGLPVAVHDDVDEARAAAHKRLGALDSVPVYQRVLAEAGYESMAQAVIVGNEESVATQLSTLVKAGASDIWAGAFPVGADEDASLRRTTDLLHDLLG